MPDNQHIRVRPRKEQMATTPGLLQRLVSSADEWECRWSVEKVRLLTELGKAILPTGEWGRAGHPDNGQPHLYLTFDDGPHPDTTPYLLDVLAQSNVEATFFLIGSNCAKYPELVRNISAAGHRIGNHSYNHLLMPMLSTKRIAAEIQRTNDVIAEITGEAPSIFRPPFGLMDARVGKCLQELNMTPVYWGSAPEDWLIPGSARVIRRVMWKITDGTLIVLHEGGHLGDQTIEAAKEIIYRSKSLGYQFSKVNVRAGLQATGR